MNQTDVKVSFYLKKSEADAKGNCPVMARLIVGKYSETAFSVKLRVPQSLWLSGRACGKSAAARDINNRLDEIRAAAFSIYAEQSANREVVTAEEVKHQLLGMASEQETLLSYFRLFMRNFEKRVGINRTESSLNGYRNSLGISGEVGNHAVARDDTGGCLVHFTLVVDDRPVERYTPVDLSHHSAVPPSFFL